MRVILNEGEILLALEDFVLANVTVPDNVRIDIDLKATRGEQGYTAEIDLVDNNDPAATNVDAFNATDEAKEEGLGIVEKIEAAKANAKAPRRRGRPAGSKNKATLEREAQAAQVNEQSGQVEAETPVEQAAEVADVEEHPAHTTTEEAEVEVEAVDTEPTGPSSNESNFGHSVDKEQAPPVDFSKLNQPDTAPAAAETQAIEEIQADTELAPEVNQTTSQDQVESLATQKPIQAPAADKPAADVTRQASGRSLFGNISDADDADVAPEAEPEPEPEPEKVELVEEPAPNSEEALAAEAAATEPTEEEEEVDYTPTVESSTLGREEEEAPAPRRSLFDKLDG